jgi:hypothetical protein
MVVEKEEALTAVTSAPKLPYNKDEDIQKNENVNSGQGSLWNPCFLFTFLLWLCAARLRQIVTLHLL